MLRQRGHDVTLFATVRSDPDLGLEAICSETAIAEVGLDLEEALRMASLYPAEAIGAKTKGSLAAGQDADFIVLSPDLNIHSTWISGACVHGADTTPSRAFA